MEVVHIFQVTKIMEEWPVPLLPKIPFFLLNNFILFSTAKTSFWTGLTLQVDEDTTTCKYMTSVFSIIIHET